MRNPPGPIQRCRGQRWHYRATAAGFTYLGVLLLVASISLVSTAALQVGSILQRRAAEEALLEIGNEFRLALNSYAKATPAGQPAAPATIQDLLNDRRFPAPRRHLRKLYADPLTGEQTWGLEMTADGNGIVGLYSLSKATPIKIGNFEAPNQSFTGLSSYRDWIFKGQP